MTLKIGQDLFLRQPLPLYCQAVTKEGNIERINLNSVCADKFNVFFFYPLDFTFVCPTELIALDQNIDKFENVNIFGISVDSVFAHKKWRELNPELGGIGPVRFTLISDIDRKLSNAFDVLGEDFISLRGTFIIDNKGKLRVSMVNDMGIGRNVDEILRLIEAIKHNDKYGEVCPMNWNKGDKGIKI